MAGITAQGTIIARETSLGSTVYTAIANVKSFDGPSTENPEVDVTTLSSSAKEFIGGLIDFGDLSMEINFNAADGTHQAIFTDMEANPPTTTGWKITFSGGQSYRWPAFPKSFSISGAVDNVYTGNLTLRLSGARSVS